MTARRINGIIYIMANAFHTIIIPVRPQPDTLIAIFLLKLFGREKYPDVEKAVVTAMNTLPEGESLESMERKGHILLDIGGGKYDHHASREPVAAAQLVAEDLDIAANPAITKLLQYAERDDKYGKGTVSTDPLDRLFGFSGLVAAVNKSIPQNTQRVVEIFMPLILAHYNEEKKRTEDLPNEFKEKQNRGEVELFDVKGFGKKMKVVIIASENPSLAGWLRSNEGIKADVVAQYLPSGHLNILTRQVKRIDLRQLAALVRIRESKLRNRSLEAPLSYLMRTGKLREVPEWYYDRATNTIQNGGVNPGDLSPTAIRPQELKKVIEQGLGGNAFEQEEVSDYSLSQPLHNTREEIIGPREYFLEIRLPQDVAENISSLITGASPGVKLHKPQNYHITLMHFGEQSDDAIRELIPKIQYALSGFQDSFTIIINPQDFSSGPVTGYENGNAFYFHIGEAHGGSYLTYIRGMLEKVTSSYKPQPFSPHMTVASTKDDVIEEAARDARLDVDESRTVEVPVKKLRLTEVYKTQDGMTRYRARHFFHLGRSTP